MTWRCPHGDVRWCPLYYASHEGDGCGCDDGNLEAGDCAVSRGLDYGVALAKLTAANPRLVAEVEWMRVLAERRAQVNRNMRLNGVH